MTENPRHGTSGKDGEPKRTRRFISRITGGRLGNTEQPQSAKELIDISSHERVPSLNQEIPTTREGLHIKSLQFAKGLANTFLQSEHDHFWSFCGAKQIEIIAKTEVLEKGAAAYREAADQVDTLKGPLAASVASELRFRAAILGDETSYEALQVSLQAEKDAGKPKTLGEHLNENLNKFFADPKDSDNKDSDKSSDLQYPKQQPQEEFNITTESRLKTVVQICAEEGIPADSWINTYSRDAAHAAQLKIQYAKKEQESGKEASLTSQSYLHQVYHEHFNDMTNEEILEVSRDLWLGFRAQNNDDAKDAVFQKAKNIFNEDGLTFGAFTDFSRLAESMLLVPDDKSYMDITDISMIIQRGKQEFVKAGVSQTSVRNVTDGIEILTTKHLEGTPENVIDAIDRVTSERLAIPEEEGVYGALDKNNALSKRDDHLKRIAAIYAQDGEFDAAKKLINAISSERSKELVLGRCMTIAKTPQQIETLTPDPLELAFAPQLADVIETHKKLKSGDPEQIAGFIREAGKSIDKEQLYTYMEQLYAVDPQAGHNLAAELMQNSDPENFGTNLRNYELAKQRFNHGDEDSLTTMFALAVQFEDEMNRMEAFNDIAAYTAEKTKDTAAKKELETEVTLYLAPDGSITQEALENIALPPEPGIGESSTSSIEDQENGYDDPPGTSKGHGKSK